MIPIVLSALTVPIPLLVAQKPSQKIDFARHFQELGVEGAIVIQSLNTNQIFQHNPQRNVTGFLPASTFKILNSLIALETKVMPDEVAVLTWDGIQRQVPEWNRDLNMREAFKRSAVWFYQVLARRVGHEPMQKWVKEAKYGNQKIGPQSDLDKFWLEGELRISPQEQIQFLRRLHGNELPFTARSVSLVKDLMIMEQTPDYTIRAKTGFVGQIGWVVGYVEKGKDVYFFATNIDIKNPKDLPTRMALTRRCLKDIGVL